MLMQTLRRTKIKGWLEYTGELCPICHKSGGCMIHENGNVVVCIRTESDKPFSVEFPSWIHYLKEKRKLEKREFIEGNIKAGSGQLNHVYRCLLNHLSLEDHHLNHLLSVQRKMTVNEIKVRGYKSLPDNTFTIVKRMGDLIAPEYLKGVPGFFEAKYGWGVSGKNGIMIPYRNEENQIIGFQVRVDNPPNEVVIDKGSFKNLKAFVVEQPNLVRIQDGEEFIKEIQLEVGESHSIYHGSNYGFIRMKKGQRYFWLSSANKVNGTGAGDPLPIHVAVPTSRLERWETGEALKTNAVWITEGGLKADITANHLPKVYNEEEIEVLGDTVLGIPGINTWKYILPVLEKMEVKHVNLAIDMDLMTNPDVAFHTRNFILDLKNRNLTANMVLWNEEDGKGIDDLFLNGKYPRLEKIF